MVSIDGGTAFEATLTSQTLIYDSSTKKVTIVPVDLLLVGTHTVDMWMTLTNNPTVITNTVSFDLTVVDTCP